MADLHILVGCPHRGLRRALTSYIRSLPGVASVASAPDLSTTLAALGVACPHILFFDADLWEAGDPESPAARVAQLHAECPSVVIVLLVNNVFDQITYQQASPQPVLIKGDLDQMVADAVLTTHR